MLYTGNKGWKILKKKTGCRNVSFRGKKATFKKFFGLNCNLANVWAGPVFQNVPSDINRTNDDLLMGTVPQILLI